VIVKFTLFTLVTVSWHTHVLANIATGGQRELSSDIRKVVVQTKTVL